MKTKQEKFKFSSLLFLIILILGVFIRVYKLNQIPPPIHVDEAFMAQSAIAILEKSRSLLETHASITVIGNLLTAILIKTLGVSIVSLRLPSVIFGILTNIFLYLLVKRLFNEKIALISLMVGSLSHLSIVYSRISLPNIQAPFFFVLTLFLVNLAMIKNHQLLAILAGISTASSLYSYTGAKIILFLVPIFIIFKIKSIKKNFLLPFILSFLFCSLPIIFYSFGNNNYTEREHQAFIFNNPKYWQDRWQTNSLFQVILNQAKTNFLSFVNQGDYSTQYGNGVNLDKISSYLLLSFFLILIPLLFFLYKKNKKNEFRNILYFIFSFATILVIVSLTDSPPLSTRLLMLYPIVSLFIAITLYSLSLLIRNGLIRNFLLSIILLLIAFINLKIYFYDYMKDKKPFYPWIEPNSSIGLYASTLRSRDIYLLPNPHTYSSETTISVFTYKKKRVQDIEDDFLVETIINSNQNFVIIIPLVPKEARKDSIHLEKIILEKTKKGNFIRKIHRGISCKGCEEENIFMTIEKI